MGQRAAQASAAPVQRYAPMSQATQDIDACAERLLERIDTVRQAASFPNLRTT